jgi:hypothetical protein
MVRLFKALLVLILIAFIALTGYAYFGDYAPEPREISETVTLDIN